MIICEHWRSIAASIFLLLTVSSAYSSEDSVETGWMELVKGSRDSSVGAEVVKIEEGDAVGMQKVTLAIPKDSIADPNEIEEVLVIGKRPQGSVEVENTKPVNITYEWVTDYDSENYGLIIRLGKNTNWPIRLYMNSEPGFVR